MLPTISFSRYSQDYGLSPLIVTSMKLYERPKGPVRSRANSISSVTSGIMPTSKNSSRRNSITEVNKKTSNPASRYGIVDILIELFWYFETNLRNSKTYL